MNNINTNFKKNPKIDLKVVSAIADLQKKLPESEKPKQGSDYRLSPPLGGHLLTTIRRGKEI